MKGFKGVIFDFDGVILDSEPAHERAQKEALRHFGIEEKGINFDDFRGVSDTAFFQSLAEQTGATCTFVELMEVKKKSYTGFFSETDLIPGWFSFLNYCRERGWKTAIATSSDRTDVGLALDRFDLRPHFEIIVTKEDTERHKPHPEPYLKAARLLHLNPEDTIVIEDSVNGIKAARAAGCYTIGITTSFQAPLLHEAGAQAVAGTYEEIQKLLSQPS